jgi:hypothetical protein
MREASKQLTNAGETIAKTEPGMRAKLLAEEKNMSEMDGIRYTEEEIEANVAKQMENNPHRVAWRKAKERLEGASKSG